MDKKGASGEDGLDRKMKKRVEVKVDLVETPANVPDDPEAALDQEDKPRKKLKRKKTKKVKKKRQGTKMVVNSELSGKALIAEGSGERVDELKKRKDGDEVLTESMASDDLESKDGEQIPIYTQESTYETVSEYDADELNEEDQFVQSKLGKHF
jgi:hypothetical protein